MNNIESVLNEVYADQSDIRLSVEDDGRIRLSIIDPDGDPEYDLDKSFYPRGSNYRSVPQCFYGNIDELISLIDYEIEMAPTVRNNIREFMAAV